MGKNQHYVPQFLLRRFATDASERAVNLFLTNSAKVVKGASIADQASENFIYGKDQIIEDIFTQLEGSTQTVIAKILEFGADSLDHQERVVLQTFVHFQATRTPRAAKYANEMLDKTFHEGFREDREIGDKIDLVSISYTQPFHETFKMSLDSQGLLSDLKLCVLKAPPGKTFCIGQHPAILSNPFFTFKNWKMSGIGFGLKGICIFLPVSPLSTLVLFDRDRYSLTNFGRQIQISVHDLEQLNRLQFYYTSDCVYFQGEPDHENLKEIAATTRSFRESDLTTLKVENKDKGKLLVSSTNSPPEKLDFSFLGLKAKHLNERFGPRLWDLSRESIRPILERNEKKKEGHETRS